MVVIGLTGGIASGKSVVSDYLNELGAHILNADLVGHRAYSPHTEVWEEVVKAFGSDIVGPDDEIDRRKLGSIVFGDPQALARLNQIMHPRMYKMMEAEIKDLQRDGHRVIVLEAAILIEANWTPLVDQIWVTYAPEPVVIQRLISRNNLTEEQALARIRSQMPPEERAKQGQVVINTDCTFEEVREQVAKHWQKLPLD